MPNKIILVDVTDFRSVETILKYPEGLTEEVLQVAEEKIYEDAPYEAVITCKKEGKVIHSKIRYTGFKEEWDLPMS